jgi:hypothetical protein
MENATKLKYLSWYVRRGWPIFPCVTGGKNPLTDHGFKDATLDREMIEAWHDKYPDANWGMRTGSADDGGAGLVVVDIDAAPAWEQLRTEHSEPIETVSVRTGGGNTQLYFKYPAGHAIKSGTNVLAQGIDIRADGGYVIVPPSKTGAPYAFEPGPDDCEVEDLPEWLLAKLNGHQGRPEGAEAPVAQQGDAGETAKNLKVALSALNALKKERADDYQQWLEVGISLFSLGEYGLVAWDQWSKQSDKFEPGVCAQKWATFSPAVQDAHRISFGSLAHWAEEDGYSPFIRLAPKNARPSHYIKALEAFGFEFSINDMNDSLYINGQRMSDLLMSQLMTSLREFDYRSKDVAGDAMASMGLEHRFHPIKDYLESLAWDGWNEGGKWTGIDHVQNLCEYFMDKDGVFPALVRKWLVGTVGRILGSRPGQQHPMLVLDGPQGIGKSRFVWWLGSPLPAFYIQNAINTNDKDFLVLLCSKWIWEVEELGATLRKSDVESLKAFLSKEIINVRKPYGHDEIVKPATASFIGTINSSGGFLADPTGSRRFRVCTLTGIDWDYEKHINVNQIWAQAVALFKDGETWELDRALQEQMIEINSRYEVDDPLAYDLFDTFNVNPAERERYTSTAQIIHRLRADMKIVGGSDQAIAQRIANVLGKAGCERDRIKLNGQTIRIWRGVWLKV